MPYTEPGHCAIARIILKLELLPAWVGLLKIIDALLQLLLQRAEVAALDELAFVLAEDCCCTVLHARFAF